MGYILFLACTCFFFFFGFFFLKKLYISLSFLSLYSRYHLSRVLRRSELKIPYSLPCACIQLAVRDGDCYAGTDQS